LQRWKHRFAANGTVFGLDRFQGPDRLPIIGELLFEAAAANPIRKSRSKLLAARKRRERVMRGNGSLGEAPGASLRLSPVWIDTVWAAGCASVSGAF
jgi:hypothetical protein